MLNPLKSAYFGRHLVILAACLTAMLASPLPISKARAQAIEGPARVVDAGALTLGAATIRLFGVDAPVESATCPRPSGAWRCGQEASWALAERIERHWVSCDERAAGAAVCFIGGRNGINLNAWLVRQGWARARACESTEFAADEEAARLAGINLWAAGGSAPPARGC